MSENIETVLAKHQDFLMGLPNVQAVGIGSKAESPVIKVFVSRKVPEESLQPHEVIPKRLERCDVEVEVIGTVSITNI